MIELIKKYLVEKCIVVGYVARGYNMIGKSIYRSEKMIFMTVKSGNIL